MKSHDLGTKIRKESFNTEILVASERKLEELDIKIEELQKGTMEDILEFAERMDARWNELRAQLHKGSNKNLWSTEVQLDCVKKVLVYGETKEKPTDSVLTTLLEFTEATAKATQVKEFYFKDQSSTNLQCRKSNFEQGN